MKPLRIAVMAITLVALSTILPASASTTLTWKNAKKAVLPSGATGLPSGYLPTLSCVSVGNCEAGGAYDDAGGAVHALILNESNGTWTTPTTLKAPAGAGSNPGMTVLGLSCSSLGNCSAAGSYQDASTNVQAFVANEVSGTWLTAREISLPANSLTTGQNAFLRSVTCSLPGDCSAVGSYLAGTTAAPRNLGFVANEIRGTWSSASQITLSASANFNPFVTINQIACSSIGNCVGDGYFIDANNVTQGLIIDEVNRNWQPGTTLTLPANASAYAGASLSEVACVKGSGCTVYGIYSSSTGAVEGLSASGTSGHWSRSVELTMPQNAGSNPHVFLYGFLGIDCSSFGNCAVGGQYLDNAGNYQGFLDNEVNGTWSMAVELILPTGAQSAGKNGGVVTISCPSNGNCRGGAAYLDGTGAYQALVIVETNGSWHQGTKVVLPAGSTTVGIDGGIYALVCVTVNSCTATGSYLEPTAFYQGLTLSS